MVAEADAEAEGVEAEPERAEIAQGREEGAESGGGKIMKTKIDIRGGNVLITFIKPLCDIHWLNFDSEEDRIEFEIDPVQARSVADLLVRMADLIATRPSCTHPNETRVKRNGIPGYLCDNCGEFTPVTDWWESVKPEGKS